VENQLKAKWSKCAFGVTKVEYLSHIISVEGVTIDPHKIIAMKQWPVSKTLKELRDFWD
jgi:hypothetical protein